MGIGDDVPYPPSQLVGLDQEVWLSLWLIISGFFLLALQSGTFAKSSNAAISPTPR
jgi:hypothetical protein